MAGEETTFGCGTFLPGFGPDNFPDFDGGGTIDGGGGDDDDDGDDGGIDPRDPPGPPIPPGGGQITFWVCTGPPQWLCNSVTQPSHIPPPPGAYRTKAACEAFCHGGPPGGGITPGGGGPPPPGGGIGPGTPGGPPGEPPGGGQQMCRCKPVGEPKVKITDHPQYKKIVITFKQSCQPHPPGAPTGKSIIDAVVKTYLGPNCELGTGSGKTDTNCQKNGKCTGPCGPIKVEIFCTKITGGDGGDATPPGGDDDGGGIIGGGDRDQTGGGFVDDDGGGIIGRGDNQGAGGGFVDDDGGGIIGGGDRDQTGGGLLDDGDGGGIIKGGDRDQTGGGFVDDDDDDGGGIIGGGDNQGIGGGFFDNGNGGGIIGGGDNQGIGGGYFDDGGFGGGITQGGDSTLFGPGGFYSSFNPNAGSALAKNAEWDKNSIISEVIKQGEINLNNPALVAMILRKKPTGIEDSDVAFIRSPEAPKLVPNNSGNTQLFNPKIDSNIEYILSNKRNFGNWNSRAAAGVTPDTVYNSLKPEVQELLGQIRNYDGTLITRNQIFAMIGTRILDGTISTISLKFLQTLADNSKKREPISIKRSSNSKVNEVAALALVERNMFTLDPAKATGSMKNILPNWKTLASDIDKYIEVIVGGKIKKYYVKDDNTFINRSTLSLEEGDYFDVARGAVTVRLFAKSEKDHAFLLPEKTRQKAIKLLGGDGGRTLRVSSDLSAVSGIEFDYSLSTPRQNFYVLSCVLSSINTKPNLVGSFLLKDSTARYELMDTQTTQGLRDINTFIKYKANHRVFILEDSDVMLDHIAGTSALTVQQTDIIFDSPKENKTIPLLTRQIPWYIMVYPTNRSTFNLFNSKSKIVELDATGTITRQLRCKTTIVPNFSKQHTNKFVRIQTHGKTGEDVLGVVNPQSRITQITSSDTVFQTGYIQNRKLTSAEDYVPSRRKTGVRLVKEIITELDTNYLLGLNGIGKSLTEFDVYSRLTLQQFNILSRTESFKTIQDSVRNGLIADVKMIPPIRRADARISFQKTQLVQRKVGAPADTFVSIKGTNDGQTIIPPTTTGPSTFGPITR